MLEAVDLFCGVGGLTYGLQQGGINVKAGYDIEHNCKYPYEANNSAQFIAQSVTEVTGEDIQAFWSKGVIRVLAGCAPCQPFSSIATANFNRQEHAKWGMLFHFSRLVCETMPEFVTMENVPGVVREEPFKAFVQTLEQQGFNVVYGVLDAANYGAPQHRKRLVLLASRLGAISLPEMTHPNKGDLITVRKAIAHLPRLESGEVSPHDPLHKAAKLNALNQQRILASREGGTWRDWPESLRADCHKKESGRHSSGVYGRMRWDSPAPTMTTLCYGYGNGRFGHPEQHRGISLREAAIFQSFPESYQFAPPGKEVSMKHTGRMIGNAVPPKLGEAIAKALLKALPQS